MRRENVLLLMGALAALGVVWGRDPAHLDLGSYIYFASYLPVCGIAWWAALRRAPGPDRRPWIMLAVFETCWLTGDLITAAIEAVFAGRTDAWLQILPWAAQAAYWTGFFPLAGMLLIMVRRRAGGQLRAGILDGMTMTTAMAIAVWHFLILPRLTAPDFDAALLGWAIYPIGDLMIVAATLLLALAPGRTGGPTRLVVGAVTLIAANDLAYNLMAALAPEHAGRLAGVALFSNVVMVAASLHRRSAELTAPALATRGLHPARVFFLGVALLTAPTISQLATGGPWGGEPLVLLFGTLITCALVLTRFVVAVREQERTGRALAHQAAHDSLTGLVNRRTMNEALRQTLAARDGAILLYVDLDGFKQVNDTAGHEAGDAVLTEVARRLTRAVRQTDVVARLGGDEFAVLCPGAMPLDTATRLAQRVLEDVAVPVEYNGGRYSVGASIGIAVPTSPDIAGVDVGAFADNLLRTADHAMFEAKRLGKGRWVVAGGSDEHQ
jgi:diguanylate cyclase (GGDEF)-like protein